MDPSDLYGLDFDENGIACDEPGNQVASDEQVASGAEAQEGTIDSPTAQESETSVAPSAMIGEIPAPPSRSQQVTPYSFLDGELFDARVGNMQETIHMIGVGIPVVRRWECLSFAALDRVRALLQLDPTYAFNTVPEVSDGEGRPYGFHREGTPLTYFTNNYTHEMG